MKRNLVHIGLDGTTFEVFDPFLDQGQLPFAAQRVHNGTRPPLLSTISKATMPAREASVPTNAAGIQTTGEEAQLRASRSL
jgi:predicted AlkP superfamily phosphohydrolase/phosphomutase